MGSLSRWDFYRSRYSLPRSIRSLDSLESGAIALGSRHSHLSSYRVYVV